MKNVTSSTFGLEPPASESTTLRNFLIINQQLIFVYLQNKKPIKLLFQHLLKSKFEKTPSQNRGGFIFKKNIQLS